MENGLAQEAYGLSEISPAAQILVALFKGKQLLYSNGQFPGKFEPQHCGGHILPSFYRNDALAAHAHLVRERLLGNAFFAAVLLDFILHGHGY